MNPGYHFIQYLIITAGPFVSAEVQEWVTNVQMHPSGDIIFLALTAGSIKKVFYKCGCLLQDKKELWVVDTVSTFEATAKLLVCILRKTTIFFG